MFYAIKLQEVGKSKGCLYEFDQVAVYIVGAVLRMCYKISLKSTLQRYPYAVSLPHPLIEILIRLLRN